jgi:hypothetical protein
MKDPKWFKRIMKHGIGIQDVVKQITVYLTAYVGQNRNAVQCEFKLCLMEEHFSFSSGWVSDISLDAQVCVKLLSSRRMWLLL